MKIGGCPIVDARTQDSFLKGVRREAVISETHIEAEPIRQPVEIAHVLVVGSGRARSGVQHQIFCIGFPELLVE
jgi:hypothetical protein